MSSINCKMLLLLALVALLSLVAAKGSNRIVVTYNGKSYDLTEFKHKHPGGEKVLETVNGKDVKEYLEGKKGVKLDHLVQHKHSNDVFTMVLPMYEIKH